MATELNLHTSPIEPGLTVIEASAGTGKTYSISHLVPRFLLEGTLPDLSKLLLVTFTKDAARELSDRVRRVLMQLSEPATEDERAGRAAHDVAELRKRLVDSESEARLRRALLDLDLLAVSTIHAFCQRSLQQEGTLCGLPVLPEVVNDDREHLEPIVRGHWITLLSADPVLAALATAQRWVLSDAIEFINTRRRCFRPKTEPRAADYTELLPALHGLVGRIKSNELWTQARTPIEAVASWNKGGPPHAAGAIAWALELHNGDPTTVAFWQSLARVAEMPDKAGKRGKTAKAAAEALAASPWILAAQELQSLCRQLQWSWQHHLAELAIPELSAALESRRLITQDGLIGALYHALHRTDAAGEKQSERLANRLAARYHVALIDESQDTDPRQFAIFKRIFLDAAPRRRLVLIGDPKQAIYSFRGADLSTYLAARRAADAVYTLSKTRRAPGPLVEVVNAFFQRPRAFHNVGMEFKPAESALDYDHRLLVDGEPCSRLEAWVVPAEQNQAYAAQSRRIRALSARVASTIVGLLGKHAELVKIRTATGEIFGRCAVTPAHLAVLVATNAQAAGMAEALQAHGVPAVINSGEDVFATDEAAELLVLLRAILDPRRARRVRRALVTRLLGLDAAALAQVDTPVGPESETPYLRWLEKFTHWQTVWTRRGLAALFSDFDLPAGAEGGLGIAHRLALVPGTGERRVTNYRHLTDLLLEANREEAARPDELVRWLGQQIARADEGGAEERQLQLSSDRQAVQVVTMHKAKGLEYPLVFCPYLADPVKNAKGYTKLSGAASADDPAPADTLLNFNLLDGEERDARIQQVLSTQLEERLRLAYVALTRAQVRLWTCSYRAGKDDLGSPLDWLLRADEELDPFAAYSTEWVAVAKEGGAARHERTLTALAARLSSAQEEASVPTITVMPPPEPHDNVYRPSAVTGAGSSATLDALPAPHIPPSWRITSFSTLTREKHAHGAPSASATSLESAIPAAARLGAAAPAFLRAPAGATVGTVVHDWIETWDFSSLAPLLDPDAPLARHLAVARLPATEGDLPSWGATLHELFSTLREIRLPGCGSTPLHELCPDAHGSEWHFHLPLAGALSAQRLAECFARHAAPEHRGYAPQLAALSDETFEGLLQGFIDRLVRDGAAWGVIDWKTNRLGSSLADYDEPALLRCAMDAHYLLQTHLYLVALRRYLRCLGLAHDRVVGAWLVFLRAIEPGGTRGVLHIDPPPAMLDALDALFAPAAAPAVP